MPSSIRVIAIVKDPMSGQDAYTLEFECMAEKSEDLMKELTKTPLGGRAIELINQAKFMPEANVKTQEELEEEAKEEEKRIEEHEAKIKEEAARQAIANRDYHWRRVIHNKVGEEKLTEITEELEKDDS